ncbi:NIPSNAP family protein [Aegicerativicinus sediminis]
MRTFFFLFFLLISSTYTFAQEQVYELRTYELEFFRSADVLHNYLKDALIPALNRQGIDPIGAFEETSESLPKKIYVLIPYKNIQTFLDSKELIERDQKFLTDAKEYINASETIIPFNNYTTNLIKSSKGFPEIKVPNENAQLFELRIYNSHNEDALRRKVKMFDDSEFGIFEDVDLPMVFFGSDIAGTHMPSLTYLLAFKDIDHHKQAWSKFGQHPEWIRITKLEEYANAMNDITRVFLKPLSYSQL